MTPSEATGLFDAALSVLDQFPEFTVEGQTLLDVGCGCGNMLLAALHRGAKSATGIDICLADFGYNCMPEVITERSLDIDKLPETLQADVSSHDFSGRTWDRVSCLNVIEHVARPAMFIRKLATLVSPGGLAHINTSPLYYSPVGHHLWPFFPQDTEPWAHLYTDWHELLMTRNVSHWHMWHFDQLNKLTSAELIAICEMAGFEVVRDWRWRTMEHRVEEFRHRLRWELVPDPEDLVVASIGLTLRKARSS